MTHKQLLTTALGCLMAAGSVAAQNTFTISGHVPGMEDGVTVRLMSLEQDVYKGELLTQTTARDGRFTLTGSVASPTLCRVEIVRTGNYSDGSTYEYETDTRLMVENVPMTMTVAHIDSLPLTYEFGHSPLEKEMNATVTGGRAQQEYAAYRKALHPAEWQSAQINARITQMILDGEHESQPDSMAHYERLGKEASARTVKLSDDFIRTHPEASISAYLVGRKLADPFQLTAREIDDWMACIANTPDTVRLARLRQQADTAKRYAAGQPVKDFAIADTLNQPTTLAAQLKPDVYTLVDFWASWCGPCRASIPLLKQLHEAWSGRMDIVSISLDQREADWRRAMKEEQMPWRQFTVTPEVTKQLADLYQLKGIPFLLLLDPDGNILIGTHVAAAIDMMLERAQSK